MIEYRYIAKDLGGQELEGVARAATESDLLGWLTEQGLTPVSIEKPASRARVLKHTLGRRRIRSSQLAAAFWQLTTMLGGGITITEALGAIAEDITSDRLRKILERILQRINQGGSLSDGVSEFPAVFNPLVRALIVAGETGGDLAEALGRVARHYQTRDQLRRKVVKALVYPIIVITFVLVVVSVLMIFVIPRFREIFQEMGGKIPAFTQTFMNVYDGLVFNIHYIIGASALLVVVATAFHRRTQIGHHFFSRTALAIPLIGRILKQAFIVRFCRTIATLLSGGVPVLEVFGIVTDMTSNDVTRSAVTQTRARIVEGSGIAEAMMESKFFPNMVIKMVQSGEKSGSLPEVLDKTAEYYEEQVDASVTILVSLLEPALIMIFGVIVFITVLALYLPVIELSNIRD